MEATIALSPGQRLGPYEIVGSLGAGGMGEVYRAHDPRLRRDVALKVLRPSLAAPEYVQRLAREARAAGALNHPNILAVFDVGTEGTVPYVVSELLEGESLRERLDRGPISYRRALEYGIHIARALAAAHDKGIRHRDVKPANVFVTTDGRVKLLDFGLAKLQRAEAPAGRDEITASMSTRPAVVRGTAGYMAPEQILGEPVDHRADIFALGAVLYEMFTGRRAFGRPSTAETQSAVLNDEPTDPLDLNPALPPAAAVAVRRCLEKNREERFQSAGDLAFHLEQIERAAVPAPSRRLGREWARHNLQMVGLVLAAVVATGLLMWLALRPHDASVLQQITFHRGRIGGARFSGEGIVYSQAISGGPSEVRLSVPGSPESRSLGYSKADVLATRGGDLALSIGRQFVGGERFIGTLAEVSVGGGTPAEKVNEVEDADWSQASGEFAVSRTHGVGKRSWLEYPIQTTLYECRGCSIRFPRISRDGRRVAFLEDPGGVGDRGHVVVVDRDRAYNVLTDEWANARGLTWSPRGDEIWFTAAEGRGNRAVWAVNLDGHRRRVLQTLGSLTIWDAAPDGRVLLSRDDERRMLVGKAPGGAAEVDLSWFDDSGLASLSTDGHLVLFGDRFGGIYLRRTDGAPAVKLDSREAYPDALSPDGSLVLATTTSKKQLILVPTGPPPEGSSAARFAPSARPLLIPGITSYSGSRWFPDGHRIVFNAVAPGRDDLQSYVLDLSGGEPRELTREGTWALSISPDGKMAAAIGHGKPITLHAVDGGPERTVSGSEPGDRPVAWSEDGGSLWVFKRDQIPTDIWRLDIASGQRWRWKRLTSPDLAGVYPVSMFAITPSGNAYFYNYRRVLSELYVVSGLN